MSVKIRLLEVDQLLAVNDALDKLTAQNKVEAELVKLRSSPLSQARGANSANSTELILWRSTAKSARRSGISDVTHILTAIEQGDPNAADKLLPLVYEELRKLAAHRMANEAAGHTLQPTALVHEAWMRLVGKENPKFANRAHFFAAAAEAMRRILIDNARRKRALRHGGDQQRVAFELAELASMNDDDQLLAVNDALDKLTAQNKAEAELVKLRYFVGLTLEEAAEVLGISARTADNYWAHARAWLFHELKDKKG